MTEERIKAYLNRIGLSDSVIYKRRDKKMLDILQYAHVTSIPYENIDIVNDVPLKLEIEPLFDKIVTRHRGGYCFELNALYNKLLESIGFSTVNCFARFLRGSDVIPMRRHRVIIATSPDTDKRIFTDVGIGERAPKSALFLEENTVQEQFGEEYKFEKDGFLGWVLLEKHNGEWGRLMSFTEEPQIEADYFGTSFFCEKSPDSVFRSEMKAAIKTEKGRMTLAGDYFRIFEGDSVSQTEIKTQKEKEEILRKYFGIEIGKI